MKIYSQALYIKRVNLQDEARLIKRREKKLFTRGAEVARLKKIDTHTTRAHLTALSLKDHRKKIVRPTAREAHLAHGFLMGTPYARMEYKTYEAPGFGNVYELAMRMARKQCMRFDERTELLKELEERWELWENEAVAYIKAQPSRAGEEEAMKAAYRAKRAAQRAAREAAKQETAA